MNANLSAAQWAQVKAEQAKKATKDYLEKNHYFDKKADTPTPSR